MQNHYNVLSLCAGNSARSIMAEGIMNFKGRPQFTAYSAGSHPSGKVRPEALRQLEIAHILTIGFRSKSWDEFSNVPDPAAVKGTDEEIQKAFRDAFFLLDRRISLFLCLPHASIDNLVLKRELDNIGHIGDS